MIASMLFTGCTVDLTEQVRKGGSFTQADADRITDKCKAEKGLLEVRTNGEIILNPTPESDDEVLYCVLGAMKEADVKKFGFIGNEAVSEAGAK